MIGIGERKATDDEARQSSRGCPRPAMRCTISVAAFSVKVTNRTWSEATAPISMAYAARWLMTRVLPDPAPARMTSGPSV